MKPGQRTVPVVKLAALLLVLAEAVSGFITTTTTTTSSLLVSRKRLPRRGFNPIPFDQQRRQQQYRDRALYQSSSSSGINGDSSTTSTSTPTPTTTTSTSSEQVLVASDDIVAPLVVPPNDEAHVEDKNKNNEDGIQNMLKFALPALGIYLSNPLLSNIDNGSSGLDLCGFAMFHCLTVSAHYFFGHSLCRSYGRCRWFGRLVTRHNLYRSNVVSL